MLKSYMHSKPTVLFLTSKVAFSHTSLNKSLLILNLHYIYDPGTPATFERHDECSIPLQTQELTI